MKDTIFIDSDPFSPAGNEPYSADKRPAHAFAFNAKVAAVFDDMISRSVPGYEKIQEMSAQLAIEALSAPCAVYDLGCSTGTSLIRLAQKITEARSTDPHFARGCHLIGIDSSADMIKRAKEKISSFDCQSIVSALQGDIRCVDLSDAGVVLCHFTLQFLAPELRAPLIQSVFNNLPKDGVFIFSEKVRHKSERLEKNITKAHEQYRQQNGYSLVEIIRKREALENVLHPFTLEANLAMLRDAGFSSCEIVHKELCFVTFLAVKE